jgi:fatty acid synthase
MGTQWPKMGRDLMTLDSFRESIMKSNAVLEPFNIHLCDLLMDAKEDAFNDTLNSFIGIAAIQVGLRAFM